MLVPDDLDARNCYLLGTRTWMPTSRDCGFSDSDIVLFDLAEYSKCPSGVDFDGVVGPVGMLQINQQASLRGTKV